MAQARFTYELPRGPESARGLEEYAVESADGERIGRVATLLDHGGELLVAIERSSGPAGRDLLAVPWDEVEKVDHEVPAVRLRIPADEVGGAATELDSARAVRGGEAEARRVTEPPEPLPMVVSADAPRVTDRPVYLLSITLLMIGTILLLAILAIVGTGRLGHWFWLLVIPAVLIAAAGVTGLRTYRNPYANGPS